MRTPAIAATLSVALLLAACHEPRPSELPRAERAGTAAPATPAPLAAELLDANGLDIGPTDAWYSRNAGRIQLDPNAPAEDLTLAMSLIAWVVRGDEVAWQKAAPRIEAAVAEGRTPLKLAVLASNLEEAKKYHAGGSPLSQKAEKERNPKAEEAYYRKAIVLNPADPDLWNHLAITSSLQKDYRSAERFAKVAMAVDPTYLSAYQELAYAYKNSERYAEAVAVASRGLNVDGDLHTKAVLLARQGQAYWMLGEKDKALGAFSSSKRLGGPAWIDSYLDGKQELGKSWQPEAAAAAEPPPASPTPTPGGSER